MQGVNLAYITDRNSREKEDVNRARETLTLTLTPTLTLALTLTLTLTNLPSPKILCSPIQNRFFGSLTSSNLSLVRFSIQFTPYNVIQELKHCTHM